MGLERFRTDFPVLGRTFPNGPLIYFDNACSTLKPRAVIEAVRAYYEERPVCGGRSQHRLGREVSRAIDTGRQRLARFLGADDAADVVFTKNATESINLVAHALPWKKGDVVVTTDKEHNSNWVPWLSLAQRRGVEVRTIPSGPDGAFDEAAMERVLGEAGDRLRLVSVAQVSNADGALVPVRRVADEAHRHGALLMVDAAQSAPHMRLDVAASGADFVAASLHKMLGPSGVGFLWARPEAWKALGPFHLGGGTVEASGPEGYEWGPLPDRYEAGLQNYAALCAVEPALDYLERVGLEAIEAHVRDLNVHASRRLGEVEGVQVHGPPPADRGSILPFSVEGVDLHSVAGYLDEARNVAVRSGAHCVHSYFTPRGLPGWVRASFYLYNTRDEVDAFADALQELVARLPPA